MKEAEVSSSEPAWSLTGSQCTIPDSDFQSLARSGNALTSLSQPGYHPLDTTGPQFVPYRDESLRWIE